jgi:hypothetical protein
MGYVTAKPDEELERNRQPAWGTSGCLAVLDAIFEQPVCGTSLRGFSWTACI